MSKIKLKSEAFDLDPTGIDIDRSALTNDCGWVENIGRGDGASDFLEFARSQPQLFVTVGEAARLEQLGGSSAKTRFQKGPSSATPPVAYDGVNRDGTIAALSDGYDLRGNVTNDGARTFAYDVENRLTSVVGDGPGMALGYDPQGRLSSTTSAGATTQFLYDGSRLSAEYDGAGTLLRRYVHGPGVDEPLVWYEKVAGVMQPRWLHQDRQGSVVAWSDGTGMVSADRVYAYGLWGEPQGGAFTGSRFRYTGQIALPEVKLYHYKARVYDPIGGRFLQTDPIGYKDDLNLYAYVGGDPVNKTDPTGTTCTGSGQNLKCQIDRVWENGSMRPATAADHKKYAKFERSYTRAVSAMLRNGGDVASVKFKNAEGQPVSFKISGSELAGALSRRTMVARPKRHVAV